MATRIHKIDESLHVVGLTLKELDTTIEIIEKTLSDHKRGKIELKNATIRYLDKSLAKLIAARM